MDLVNAGSFGMYRSATSTLMIRNSFNLSLRSGRSSRVSVIFPKSLRRGFPACLRGYGTRVVGKQSWKTVYDRVIAELPFIWANYTQ
jgi:hypothetical protein